MVSPQARQTWTLSELPHGGGHESRKYIAEQLSQPAEEGQSTLTDLTAVARRALVHNAL